MRNGTSLWRGNWSGRKWAVVAGLSARLPRTNRHSTSHFRTRDLEPHPDMDYLIRRGQLNRNTVWQAVNVLALRKTNALLVADFPPRMFASRREIASCTVPRVVKINLYPYMWVIRLLEFFAWVVCVTDLLMSHVSRYDAHTPFTFSMSGCFPKNILGPQHT